MSSSPPFFAMARFDLEAVSGCRAGVHATFEDSAKLEDLLSPSKAERPCRGLRATWFSRRCPSLQQRGWKTIVPARSLNLLGTWVGRGWKPMVFQPLPTQTILGFCDLTLASGEAGQSAAIWGSLKVGLCPWGSPGSMSRGGRAAPGKESGGFWLMARESDLSPVLKQM